MAVLVLGKCVRLASEETCHSIFDEISIDVKEKTLLPHISLLKQDFKLPFGGTVSWSKGKVFFMISKFKGMPLYLNGDDHRDLNSYALSVPWCIPCYRKGTPDFKKMEAATVMQHPEGETGHVAFFDVTTFFNNTDFTVVHETDGQIPPGCSEMILTFPYIKANPSYVDKENLPMRRRMSDHEASLNKKDVDNISWAMGPKTTAKQRLLEANTARQQTTRSRVGNDEDIAKMAKHILA